MAKNLNFSKEFETFSGKEELKRKMSISFSVSEVMERFLMLTFIQDLEIPIIGVNTGRLGFLAISEKTRFLTN
jgi:NAD+ kinase